MPSSPNPDPVTPGPGDKPPPAKGAVAAILGGAAFVSLFFASLDLLEGKRNVGYRDIVGIPTNCTGNTKNVVVGRYYSDAECELIDSGQALVHLAEVRKCTPGITGNQLVAAGLLTYNIGGPKYCRSTVARRFNAGDRRGACDAFPMWNRAGGRVVRGLVRRRAIERSICLKADPA